MEIRLTLTHPEKTFVKKGAFQHDESSRAFVLRMIRRVAGLPEEPKKKKSKP